MDDPKKKLKKIFFLSKFQNGPIRKVNRLKSKFEDIFVHQIFIKKLNILHCYVSNFDKEEGEGMEIKNSA